MFHIRVRIERFIRYDIPAGYYMNNSRGRKKKERISSWLPRESISSRSRVKSARGIADCRLIFEAPPVVAPSYTPSTLSNGRVSRDRWIAMGLHRWRAMNYELSIDEKSTAPFVFSAERFGFRVPHIKCQRFRSEPSLRRKSRVRDKVKRERDTEWRTD